MRVLHLLPLLFLLLLSMDLVMTRPQLIGTGVSNDVPTWSGLWGSWARTVTFCPEGSFVYGYRLKTESKQGSGDDTALNEIELFCRKPNSGSIEAYIKSSGQKWGNWGSKAWCSETNNPVVGFKVLQEDPQGRGDDTALNAVDLYCRFGQHISAGRNTHWGGWKDRQMCPTGYAVTGIRTQVESLQGGGDDTALNGVKMYCRIYPSDTEGQKAQETHATSGTSIQSTRNINSSGSSNSFQPQTRRCYRNRYPRCQG